MFSNNYENGVYSLITNLCEHFLEEDSNNVDNYIYVSNKTNATDLKKLRAKAFEILLKKSPLSVNNNEPSDVISELLKHTFVLRVGAGLFSQARELENYILELTKNDLETNPIIRSTLLFLNELKSCERKTEASLDVFHYGKINPCLPEVDCEDKSPTFQMYPIKSLYLSDQLESVLKLRQNNVVQNNIEVPGYKFPFLNTFISTSSLTNDTELARWREGENGSGITATPTQVSNLCAITEYTMGSYFLPNIYEENTLHKECYATFKEGIVTEPESPWQCTESSNTDAESVVEDWDTKASSCSTDKEEKIPNDLNAIWENIDKYTEISNSRTWETLGTFDPKKEPPFVTESTDAMLYLTKLKHATSLSLLPEKIINTIEPITEIPRRAFIENVKLLLLGIESECFLYGVMECFQLRKNTVIPELSVEALENMCFQVIHWGNCFKSLSNLTSPNPKTGKLQVEGLIFKALCNSINEFLLFYKAAVLRIKIDDDPAGLLKFLNKVRPLGLLIHEVAKLCKCNEQGKTALGEGIGILTHVYDQATRVTKPKVALVFYSILQSCCEVYFRLLQQWLFEGICEDIYDEFMIKVRPKYLRLKAHRFWTRAFGINTKSVPGFLNGLTNLILECGKSVRLLKTCDPKNPICYVSSVYHPPMRVCLSVAMQNEQAKFYEEYMQKGQEAMSEIVSFSSAIQDKKDEEKRRGNLVILAQQETLLRLKREQEESLRKIAEEKFKLLTTLKDQAEESALRKERNRDVELQADKVMMESIMREEEKAKNLERNEKENTLKYYNELAAEAERRCFRADWRIRRMKLFDERILALSTMRTDYWKGVEEENVNFLKITEDINIDVRNKNVAETCVTEDSELQHSEGSLITCEDENRNVTDDEVLTIDKNKNIEEIIEVEHFDENVEKRDTADYEAETIVSSNKPTRPAVLDLTSNNSFVACEKYDNMTAAQRNKLRVLQQEFGITPNNNLEQHIPYLENETNKNINYIQQNFGFEQLKEIQANRLRNMRHSMDENWGLANVPRKPTNVISSDAQKNRAKIMSHDASNLETQNKVVMLETIVTEAQRNKERNLAHSIDHILMVPENVNQNATQLPMESTNELLTADNAVQHETPMSCTTDHFTHSINSTSLQLPSSENTPYSDEDSDMNFDEMVKSRKLLREYLEDYNFLGPGSNFSTPVTESTLTITDVDMINSTSLQVYLKKSVIIPLQVQSRLVNNAIIKYFLQEHHLLTHLQSLRDYFFLLNGEFAKSLTNSLYKRLYEVSTPLEFFNSTVLKHILERAINCSLSNNYANSDLLSFYATDVPSKLQVSNPEALNCLLLNYKISWPLNIILDDSLIEQYSKVFKFLLMVGRVLWVLQEDFHILKVERKTAIFEQFHKIQLYRHAMMQFMNALHTYLTCSVLHASWAEFEKELENVTTLDEFYTVHVSYIKKILSRCMLNQRGEIMRKHLCTIFNIILKFHNRIRSQTWIAEPSGCVHPNYKKLEEMYNSFCHQRAYLAHVAEKLTTSGYQPHLTHFLHALNINSSFKLTSKRT